MDDAMKKKVLAAAAALFGAFAFGESQLLDIEGRLSALEEIHPELAEEAEEAEEIEEAPVEEEELTEEAPAEEAEEPEIEAGEE